MGYTLIIGRDDDLCCQLLRERLLSMGHQMVYLPENQLFPRFQFAWELIDGRSRGTVGFETHTVSFDEIDAVLARFSGIVTSPQDFQTRDGQYLNSEWHALVRGYVHSLRCPVINRVGPELWYKSFLRGPELISHLPDLKLLVPRTTTTTSFEEARRFFDACGGRICYTPVTTRSTYSINSETDVRKLESLLRVFPVQLSEMIAGDQVDAYVVGRRVVFEGQGDASAANYCLEAAQTLHLGLCHFRLTKAAGGEWYCRSLDCSPSLFECSDNTRGDIVSSLVEILCCGTESGAS